MAASRARISLDVGRMLANIQEERASERRKTLVGEHFDAEFYRYCYPQFLADGHDPLDHYLRYGAAGRLDPHPDFACRAYAARFDLDREEDPYFHYLSRRGVGGRGFRTRLKASDRPEPSDRRVEYFTAQLFDADYYLSRNPDVRRDTCDPLRHYMERGWREHRDPNRSFSNDYYLDRYEDARAAGINPLCHYVTTGRAEGRRISVVPTGDPAASPDAADAPNAANANDALPSADSLFVRLAHRQPDFPAKWLRRTYLATGLSELQRGRAFAHHYDFIARRIDGPRLEHILFEHLDLWRETFEAHEHLIRLTLAGPSVTEGELSLEFICAGVRLYTLSFSFVPGDWSDGRGGARVLISRLQGPKDNWDAFKAASRRMGDVSGPYALMAALQGLAVALGVRKISAVSARRQSARGVNPIEAFEATYDQFFTALGLVETEMRLFEGALPLTEKPMSEVKRGHRIRTRLKREIKRRIAAAAAEAIAPGVAIAAFAAPVPKPDLEPAPDPAPEVRPRPALLEAAG
jgi:uncharacterized protein VirK/YbjX